VTEDCRSECEVRHRIALAKEAFIKKKDLVWIPQPPAEKTNSQSILIEYSTIYGSETWTLQKVT